MTTSAANTPDGLVGEGRVLVTGGAQGVGRRIAERVLGAGGRVVIGDVQEERGRDTVRELGGGASFVTLDVSDAESWDAAVQRCGAEMGGLDALVNNAGILHLGPLEAMQPAHVERILSVNLLGPTLGIRAVAPVLRGEGGGSIVNISSVAGLEGRNATVAYTASKWGVRGLTKATAMEYGIDGIRVNSVCPSMGNPDMFAPFIADMDFQRYADTSPRPRLYDGGRPCDADMDDVAAMVLWLLSTASRRCTGADFVVDAGWTAGTRVEGMPGF